MKFNTKLSPQELERLAILAEECAEVTQVVGKILRHGYASIHPRGGPDNRELLEIELGDLGAVISLLVKNGDVDAKRIEEAAEDKLERVGEFLHHQHSGVTKR